MARNGSGTYSNPYPDFVAGTTISSTETDANNSDIATALTQSIAVDGQSVVTGNIPMATYKFTGVGVGSASTDSTTLGQVQAAAFSEATDTGAADAYAMAPSPAITAYAKGQKFSFVSTNASTGASTLDVSGLGVKAIEYQGSALTGAEIAAGATIKVEYDGTAFQMVSPSNLLGAGNVTASSTDTFTNKTIDANGTGNSITNIDVADLANGTDGELITWDAAGAPAVVAVGTAAQVLTSGGAGVAPTFQTPAADTFASQLLHVQDQQTSGTQGGSASATTNHTRVLNTVVTNEITSASLGSNQISLPAGTYYIEASAPVSTVANHKAFLYNTSDTADEIIGTSEDASSANAGANRSFVVGRFTIAGTKVFELRHYTTAARATFGLGVNTGTGQIEVYADVKIWKVA